MSHRRWPRPLRRSVIVAASGLLVTMLPQAAQASTGNTNVDVSATVAATCSMTVNPLDFGTYAAAQLDVTTTIDVICSDSAGYSIGLDAGAGPGATTTTRVMANGGQTLNYALYSSLGSRGGGGPVIWGNNGRAGQLVGGTGTAARQSYTVFGRVFANQSATPGRFTDTVTATISY